VPGEIRPADAFYSYRAKYLDEHGAELLVPAEVDEETADRIRSVSVEAFRALSLEGMARVDMFLEPSGSIVVNEVNTIPGFTSISMYPKLWEASGLPYRDLVTKLIELAIERHERRSTLLTRYDALDDPEAHG
jgi:D-alanine-D-alanine ligase